MTNPDPAEDFARIFDELNNLLEFAVKNFDKPMAESLPVNIDTKLADLERDVTAFCKLNEELIERSKALGYGRTDQSHLTKKEKKCVERSEKLIKEAEEKLKTLPQPTEPPIKGFTTSKERRKHAKRISRKKI